MATAALRRVTLPLARSRSSLFLQPLSRPCSSAASHAVAAPSTGSKKVADRIVKMYAIDPEGSKHEIIGLTGQTLLRALMNGGLIDPASHRLEEIDACSSECEVHIAQEWLEKLPPASYDERYILTRNSRNRILNKHARLGCQVVLQHDLQGMVVAVPEAKPWDTP
ncbi:hypothetical protein Cni_G24369 [Canna indica]|uniref:Ferredoxin n=1 Tax=Canna indica TaxID=4628 RepID=A0AAQ3KV70_9LILI|nr:hypothetical protein Cni_G24369 [Canna indica]